MKIIVKQARNARSADTFNVAYVFAAGEDMGKFAVHAWSWNIRTLKDGSRKIVDRGIFQGDDGMCMIHAADVARSRRDWAVNVMGCTVTAY
jgi:hypothetical protein